MNATIFKPISEERLRELSTAELRGTVRMLQRRLDETRTALAARALVVDTNEELWPVAVERAEKAEAKVRELEARDYAVTVEASDVLSFVADQAARGEGEARAALRRVLAEFDCDLSERNSFRTDEPDADREQRESPKVSGGGEQAAVHGAVEEHSSGHGYAPVKGRPPVVPEYTEKKESECSFPSASIESSQPRPSLPSTQSSSPSQPPAPSALPGGSSGDGAGMVQQPAPWAPWDDAVKLVRPPFKLDPELAAKLVEQTEAGLVDRGNPNDSGMIHSPGELAALVEHGRDHAQHLALVARLRMLHEDEAADELEALRIEVGHLRGGNEHLAQQVNDLSEQLQSAIDQARREDLGQRGEPSEIEELRDFKRRVVAVMNVDHFDDPATAIEEMRAGMPKTAEPTDEKRCGFYIHRPAGCLLPLGHDGDHDYGMPRSAMRRGRSCRANESIARFQVVNTNEGEDALRRSIEDVWTECSEDSYRTISEALGVRAERDTSMPRASNPTEEK